MPPPVARSLILDLLSTLSRGSMPVGALVEAGGFFGLEENNIRVSLARLHRTRRVERDKRGRYRLGPGVAAVSRQLQSWRDLGKRSKAWQGDWVGVQCGRLGRGATRRRRESALSLLGFRELEAGFSIRPDNLRGGISQIRSDLTDLATGSTPEDCSLGRVFTVRNFDSATEVAARGLWEIEQIQIDDRAAQHSLLVSMERTQTQSEPEAMVETFLVGGEVLRRLIRHPLLPVELLPPDALLDLLETMRAYDRIGREHWSRFLAGHGVPHRTLPLNSSTRPMQVHQRPQKAASQDLHGEPQ